MQKYQFQVISLLNQKGGVGKTTLSVHLATAFAMEGAKVLLVDADKQKSAIDWAAIRGESDVQSFPVIGLPSATMHREVAKFRADYDIIIIDGAPHVNEVARSAILASDLAIIPVQPSPYDIWASKEIVDLIREASVYNENLACAFIINRKIVNTAIGRDVVAALADYEFGVLDSQVSQRVSFAESAGVGQTVLETDYEGLASQEIRALVSEIKGGLTHA